MQGVVPARIRPPVHRNDDFKPETMIEAAFSPKSMTDSLPCPTGRGPNANAFAYAYIALARDNCAGQVRSLHGPLTLEPLPNYRSSRACRSSRISS
jgi:hypothetical protein